MHGSDDGLVPVKASENLHNECISEDKTFEVSSYPYDTVHNLYHT